MTLHPAMRVKAKKCFSIILALALIVTLLPLDTVQAYAASSEIHGYVEDIFLYENYSSGPGLKNYEFKQDIKEYNVVFPDSRDPVSNIRITIPQQQVNELSFAALIGEKEQEIQNFGNGVKGTIHKITQQITQYGSGKLFTTVNFPIGESRDFTVRVGKYDDDSKTWSVYDDYTYHVTRSLTLRYNVWRGNASQEKQNGLVVKVGTENVSPAFDPREDAYTSDYTAIIGEADEISLALNPTTKGTRLYVGSGENRIEFTAQQAKTLKIADYKNSDDNNVSIPITLEYGEGDNKLTRVYTLHTDSKNYPPEIITQPQDTTVNKGGDTPLTVTAKVPAGVTGTLSYQWYEGTNAITGTKINGATEASYLPPSVYAGSRKYCCVVTNTIGKASFTETTAAATYTVNLNRLTAPEFVSQPTIDGNENSFFYVQNQKPAFSFRLVSDSYGKPIEGAEYEFQVYRSKNQTTSIEESEPVAATVSAGAISGSTRQYTASLDESQDIIGEWYYFIVLTAKKDGLDPDSRTSKTVKTVFKKVSDVVKNLEGIGSETDPFLINNIADLQYVRDMVNGNNGYQPYNFEGQTLKLTADNYNLGASWEPIGTLKEGCTTTGNGVNILPFSGILDGNGKKVICGMNGKPLFGYVRRATVKNLNIFGSKIKGYGLVENYCVDYGPTGVYVNDPVKNRTIDIENVTILKNSKILKAGFIGGYASGVNQVNIRNCTIQAGVQIGDPETGVWVGLGDTSYGYGFISEGFDHRDNIGSFAGAFNGTITNSVSYATVYGRKNVGGLVGMKGQSMGSCDILNSSFQGKIIATGDKVGGIVGAGYISGSAPGTPTVEIHNCYVAADIQGNDKIGGLVGSEEGHEKFNDTGDSYGIKGANSISDNLFYGTIKAGENAKNIGGILGYVHDFSKKNGEATNFYLDSCGASSGIGGSVEGSMTGVDKYAAAASESEFKDGTVLTKLNASPTSYQNWEVKDNNKYPTTTDKAVVTSLSIEGEYKTEYVLGEELDLTGIKIYANWSDKKKTELEIGSDSSKENVVTYSGYDKNTRGLQTITFQYKAIKATIGVTVLKPVTNPDEKITVRFTLYGDEVHNSDKEGATSHTLSAGNLTPWISGESYQVGVNATVWDLLKEVQTKHSTEIKFNNKGNYIDYLYYDSTKGSKFDRTTYLGEFTNGKKSGWMYTLNGTHPLLGVQEQFLNNGDSIVWHYTDDYTKEEGSDKWGIPGADEVKNVTTDTKAGTTTSPTDVKVSEKTAADGTKEKVAEVTVSADNQKEIIKQAKDNKSNEIILVVSKDSVKGATKADIKLDKSFIDSIVKDTNAKLTVKTPLGDKTYTQDELKALSAGSTGSTVTVTIEKAEEPVDDADQAAKIAKAKKLTASMKLTVRTEKTAKKNIKVTIKTNSKTTASIKELKDLGYTVKYRYYRSAKKAASYKSAVTKSTKTYINTAGTKGKMYYYKAQVRVYDENGKLIAKTALKQCKYANRKWSK